jgi:hypothetical protein
MFMWHWLSAFTMVNKPYQHIFCALAYSNAFSDSVGRHEASDSAQLLQCIEIVHFSAEVLPEFFDALLSPRNEAKSRYLLLRD